MSLNLCHLQLRQCLLQLDHTMSLHKPDKAQADLPAIQNQECLGMVT